MNTNSICGIEDDIDLAQIDMGINMSGWHVYSGLWESDGTMRSYCDGVELASFAEPDGGGLDQPMFLLISAAKSKLAWPDPVPADIWTLFDYVRVWSK